MDPHQIQTVAAVISAALLFIIIVLFLQNRDRKHENEALIDLFEKEKQARKRLEAKIEQFDKSRYEVAAANDMQKTAAMMILKKHLDSFPDQLASLEAAGSLLASTKEVKRVISDDLIIPILTNQKILIPAETVLFLQSKEGLGVIGQILVAHPDLIAGFRPLVYDMIIETLVILRQISSEEKYQLDVLLQRKAEEMVAKGEITPRKEPTKSSKVVPLHSESDDNQPQSSCV